MPAIRSCITFRLAMGAGAESSDSTLAAGRAALDEATRNTLLCVSSGIHAADLPPGEGKHKKDRLRHSRGIQSFLGAVKK